MMCYPTDYTESELRAIAAALNPNSSATARPSRDARLDASPASAAVDEPISETHDER